MHVWNLWGSVPPTRLRTTAIEEGRWNRRGRGRLPVEESLCSCGEIQSEQHVVADCFRKHIRQEFNVHTIENLMLEGNDFASVGTIVHRILAEFSYFLLYIGILLFRFCICFSFVILYNGLVITVLVYNFDFMFLGILTIF